MTSHLFQANFSIVQEANGLTPAGRRENIEISNKCSVSSQKST